jgi:mannose-1-phosphate guanylyltransferase
MIAVIIAGGSGTRLWPLSTPSKPKHLLKLTGERSLLQSTYDRARLVSSDVYVLTDESHDNLVREQLPDVDAGKIIVEPGRRGTASCIVLALARLAEQTSDDPVVAFLHADHHIPDTRAFSDTVRQAAKLSQEKQSITLVGINPSYPATGFGYIKKGNKLDDGAFEVAKFKEKPSLKIAERYLKSHNYLWNMGLFVAPISVFEQSLSQFAPKRAKDLKDISKLLHNPERLKKRYAKMSSGPIDTELLEKSSGVAVVEGGFDWVDIGSYKDLHEVLPAIDKANNSILGDSKKVFLSDSTDTVVVTSSRPIAVIGLNDVVVIDTDEGLLVCSKDNVQDVKLAAKYFE